VGQRRRLIAAAAAAVIAAAAVFAPPARYVVEGVSMAPGVRDGEVVRSGWFPAADRWRRPRRFDRWAIEATDGTVVKRVVALPGERVAIRDGDLAIDGRIVLKEPRRLAELGLPVAPDEPHAARERRADEVWLALPREVLDETGLDGMRSHVLAPVRDVGVAAVLRVTELPPVGFVRVRVQVGSWLVPWRLTVTGRHAIVAGRLDGHLVAAAWHVPATSASGGRVRSCLPAGAPVRWQVAEPWSAAVAAGEPMSPRLAIRSDPPPQAIVVEQAALWRDVCYRPGANGTLAWPLESRECFVLGDHPAVSTDSRQWGPIPLSRLRHRLP